MDRTDFIKVREEMGISQAELADILGVHSMKISKMERGTIPCKNIYTLLIDSVLRGVRAQRLLQKTEKPVIQNLISETFLEMFNDYDKTSRNNDPFPGQ